MTTQPLNLHFKLKSDTTFGRGDGVPGEVDAEVQHDALGLPFYGGRALKGILAMECADILFALGQEADEQGRWWKAAASLFGQPGSMGRTTGNLTVGDATLPGGLVAAVRQAVENKKISPRQILASLTTTRAQTSNDVETGAPQDETLRTMRVVLRNTVFCSPLRFRSAPGPDEMALLAACVSSLRRLGTGRHRGRGEIEAWLTDAQNTALTSDLDYFFKEAATK